MKGNPNLIHPEIGALYEHDFSIPRETIERILALPRPSLIKDLEEVLAEAIRNFKDYDGFYEAAPEESLFLAPAHAIFLLGELGAIEALPSLNKFLSQEEAFIDFWLGDLVTEEIWQPIYKLAEADIVQLLPFVSQPVPYIFAKAPHLRAALLYLGLNRKERQLVPSYSKTFQELTRQAKATPSFTEENNNLTNAVFFALDYGLVELMDEIEPAVKEELIDDYGPESWEIVQKELIDNEPEETIQDIYEHYEAIKEWYNFEEPTAIDSNFKANKEYKSREFDYSPPKEKNIDPRLVPKTVYNDTTPFKKAGPDVGRNEPCPCGSGKKYKKCCLRK